MNRLQKKCLIVTAGMHLLLVVILLVGPGFFAAKPKPDDTQVLDVIPANLIDAAFTSGVKNAPPAPPAPPTPKPIVTPPPTPEPPKPPVTPPTFVEKVEKIFTPEPVKTPPDDSIPVEKPAKPKPHKIEVDLKPVVRKVVKNTDTSDPDAEAKADAKEQKRVRDQQRKAFLNAARSIKENASSATTVEMPGTSSVSYANYASVVKSIYTQAWTPPDDTASDDANVRVSVVIGSDGTVISSSVLTPSGDASVDRSVQRTLDRVNFIAPFPDGSKEKEKTFIINFNLKAKRMLG
jgi:TonB family protein